MPYLPIVPLGTSVLLPTLYKLTNIPIDVLSLVLLLSLICPPFPYTSLCPNYRVRNASPSLLSTFTAINELKAENKRIIREGKKRDLQYQRQELRRITPTSDEDTSSSRPVKRSKFFHANSNSTETPKPKSKAEVFVIDDDMAVDEDTSRISDRVAPKSPSKKRSMPAAYDVYSSDDEQRVSSSRPQSPRKTKSSGTGQQGMSACILDRCLFFPLLSLREIL